ncbi:MAG: hypothetical protein NTY20_06055 [Candidatus Aenigmarchaeota archaeon]|nr:hypothetical protein [Candidatus Aenigmarchaeota archaeon]
MDKVILNGNPLEVEDGYLSANIESGTARIMWVSKDNENLRHGIEWNYLNRRGPKSYVTDGSPSALFGLKCIDKGPKNIKKYRNYFQGVDNIIDTLFYLYETGGVARVISGR